MNLLRIIYFICWTAFLSSMACATRISRSDREEQLHGKPRVFGGPVYTFVKTDKKANIKWGVRHYLPRKN